MLICHTVLEAHCYLVDWAHQFLRGQTINSLAGVVAVALKNLIHVNVCGDVFCLNAQYFKLCATYSYVYSIFRLAHWHLPVTNLRNMLIKVNQQILSILLFYCLPQKFGCHSNSIKHFSTFFLFKLVSAHICIILKLDFFLGDNRFFHMLTLTL